MNARSRKARKRRWTAESRKPSRLSWEQLRRRNQGLQRELERLRKQLAEREIAERDRRIADNDKQIAEAEKKIADLERQLAMRLQNSTTSSKPPSSDGLAGSPRRRGGKKKGQRQPGGQPGRLQYCWAHFKRNILGALELAKTSEAERFCRDMLALHARLFRLWHRFRGNAGVRGAPISRQQLRIQYGRGEVNKRGAGLAIRWREPVLMPDGSIKHVRRYLALGSVSRDEANRRLSEKLVESGSIKQPVPNVTFREHAAKWVRDVLPMYKFSVRESYRMILEKHLTPRFGDMLVSAGTTEASRFLINMQSLQAFVAEMKERNYSAHSIHHYHEVIRVVLKYAKKWYRSLESNPAEGVTLPKWRPKKKPWALTVNQASQLLMKLSDRPKIQGCGMASAR